MQARRLFLLLLFVTGSLSGQTKYKLPPKEVVDILDAPPTPSVVVSPKSDAMLLVESEPHPPISLLARPIYRLGGLRIDPDMKSRQRTVRYTGIEVRWFEGDKRVRISLPSDSRIGLPAWSNDGSKIAFTKDADDGVELWIADISSGVARPIGSLKVNDVLGSPYQLMNDNTRFLVKLWPHGDRLPPAPPRVPSGPHIEETSGRVSRPPTYQDLLRTTYDEDLFEYFAYSQLAIVDARTGHVEHLGEPGMYLNVSFSPDENYLLVTKLKRPFSFRVPHFYFARTVEVWNRSGQREKLIADLPVSDDVPTQGVPTGPRMAQWQPLHPANLIWVEALDGGAPLRKVPFRESVRTLAAPFRGEPREVMKLQHRSQGFEWTAKKDQIFTHEYDRDRRWRTTSLVDLSNSAKSRKVVFDLSTRDAYNHPGNPIYKTLPNGDKVFLQDGDWIYLAGQGASEKGNRPFLDRMNLSTLKKERLFQCDEKSVEQFVSFVKEGRTSIVTRYESPTEAPNYHVLHLKTGERRMLTAFKDPAPHLTGVRKELVKYAREDGVPLSGTLYLPPGYQEGTKLPLLVWAYPLEYSDAGTAGQVRASPNAFTFFRGASPLFFVTQGYAVLMDATMPVVGDPETVNNTFVEQIVASAKAAIDKLDALGVIDRSRVFVSGHSYGAFMTANLLAHSDLFVAGIARSGAYNRTLTPFGFQSERRSFWEARDVYIRVSPFTYADKINEPILLIHGEADNNSGTFPIQSERLFQALRGNGGTARLVMLPHESHGYIARESVLHVLAEMFEWAEKHVKNRVVVGDK
jgi:dipeptidyl aminopeptidase/acylaminoacyl peptidase